MFKSKKNRDSALLIFMALVMVAFLLYLFFPTGPEDNGKEKPPVKKIRKEVPRPEKDKEATEEKTDLFKDLRIIFRDYFSGINTGDITLGDIPRQTIEEELRKSLATQYEDLIHRALKYRLQDMDRAMDVFEGSDLSGPDRFDLYTALFLVRASAEDITGRCLNFTSDEVVSLLNLKYYSLIGNEAAENYQTLPVLIFADMLVKRADIFSPGEDVINFARQVSAVGDISPMQHINSVKDIFTFSRELRKFSFNWVEKDGLDPDDKGEYRNISVRRRRSFKLHYLLFPDPEKSGDLTWLRDLMNADGGSIELAEMGAADETPGENYSARSIIYSEGTPRFVLVMDSPSFVTERGYIAILLNEKMKRLNKENIVINFAEKLYSKKEFRKKMETFGKFLYNIRSVFN